MFVFYANEIILTLRRPLHIEDTYCNFKVKISKNNTKGLGPNLTEELKC